MKMAGATFMAEAGETANFDSTLFMLAPGPGTDRTAYNDDIIAIPQPGRACAVPAPPVTPLLVTSLALTHRHDCFACLMLSLHNHECIEHHSVLASCGSAGKS